MVPYMFDDKKIQRRTNQPVTSRQIRYGLFSSIRNSKNLFLKYNP